MLGAIIGDTVGSIYEFCNTNSTKFQLFSPYSKPTDDSVMSMAVAEWLLTDPERTQETLEECMVRWGHRYPRAGYGGAFSSWLFNPDFLGGYRDEYNNFDDIPSGRHPYNSWGNGSAMRCSACGWVAETLNEALELSKRSAEITHNHPEGIKGAQAIAAAIWMARHDATKEEIKEYIMDKFGYNLNRDCDDIRPNYYFDVSCQGTVPEAIIAFLDSWDFESAIRLAVSLGGDSDTLACITGGISEAFYKEIPEHIITEMRNRLDPDWWDIINGVKAVANQHEAPIKKYDIMGIPTGITVLDEILLGLHPSDLILIGGGPRIGKTSFMVSMVNNITFKQGIPTAVLSLEVPTKFLQGRLLMNVCDINIEYSKFLDMLSSSTPEEVNAKLCSINKSMLIIDNTPPVGISQLQEKVYAIVEEYGIKLFFVDYLELMIATEEFDPYLDRKEEFRMKVHSLKQLAVELDIAIVVFSSLRKKTMSEVESDGYEPCLYQIGCGAYTEEALNDLDVICLLHRPDLTKNQKSNIEDCQIIIAKNRNSSTKNVWVKFNRKHFRFENIE